MSKERQVGRSWKKNQPCIAHRPSLLANISSAHPESSQKAALRASILQDFCRIFCRGAAVKFPSAWNPILMFPKMGLKLHSRDDQKAWYSFAAREACCACSLQSQQAGGLKERGSFRKSSSGVGGLGSFKTVHCSRHS